MVTEPRAGEIQAVTFPTDLAPPRLAELHSLLSPDEQARAERFRFERDRGRWIAARGQLRIILGRATHQPPAALEFDYGAFGKPALRGAGGRLHFNLSCSSGLGMVAVGLDDELGVDVERVRMLEDAPAIAARMFTAREHRTLQSLPVEEQPACFFQYWTRKEAVVKSLGRGLSYPMNGFELSAEGGRTQRLELDVDGVRLVRWVLPVSSPSQGFVAAFATAGPVPALAYRAWRV